MNTPIRVLCVDDNPLDRELIRDALAQEHGGFVLAEAASRAEFEARLAALDCDVVLSDVNILGFHGLQVLEAVHAQDPQMPVVIVTGTGSEEVAVEALRRGAADYLVKTPQHIRRLPYTIQAVLELARLEIDRKRAEANQQLAVDVLRLLNRPNNLTVLVEELMRLIRRSLDFDAVGLRVREGEDFPYYMQTGFSDAFLREENSLCAKDHEGMVVRDASGKAVLECMCGNIICGRTDPALPYFMPSGSFWTNSTTELLTSTNEEDRQGPTRGRCNSDGYESLALIPLRSGDEIIGLLQLNDRQRGRFTLELIRFFEGLAASIGIALKRRQDEEALQAAKEAAEASQAQYQQTVAMISDVVWRCEVDGQGQFVSSYFSPVVDRLLGLSAGTVGNSLEMFLSYVHPEDLPALQETLFAGMRGLAQDATAEYRLRTLDGKTLWVRSKGSAYLQPDGRIIGFGTTSDITERKQAEEALLESESRYRALFDNTHSGVAVYEATEDGADFVFKEFNRAAQRIERTPKQAVVGRRVTEVFTGVRAMGLLDVFQRVWRTGRPVHHPVCLYRDEKIIGWRENFVCKLPSGEVVAIYDDVTERKRTEQSLIASETKYRRLHESMRDAFVKVDMSGRIQESNRAYQKMLGYEPGELSELTYIDLTPNKWHAVEAGIVQEQILVRGYSDIYEKEFRRKDGTVFPVELRASLLADDTGQPTGIWAIVRDITDRKRAKQQLQAANERLEQAAAQAEELAVRAEAANRAKSEFLANMSHEIRTPMSAITGFAELLISGECSAGERREHLSTIQRNAESLLTIINDILDLSKIEAERLHLEQMDWSPRQVVEDVETLLRCRANERQLSLEVTYVDPLPSVIRTDPERLRQILVNLVGNAIKFTDSGGVHLTVRWIPGKGGRSQMQFEVTDSGIGISVEGVQGLFEPFSQVDMSSTRRFGGTGLGLSISQRLAEMLGGRIDVRSQLGEGSTFTLTIDAGPTKIAAMPPSSSAPRTAEDRPLAEVFESLHGRVLLVEDVPEMTHLMRCTLTKTSLELDLAKNGVVACEKAMASKAAKEPYDLILMDIRMPVMNGYEATRRLRAEGWVGPIVALTAHSMRGDREQCLEAGCNDYLSKPVSQAAFFGVLERYLGGKDHSADEPPEPAVPSHWPAEGKLFDGLLDDATVNQLLEEYAATLLVKAEALAGALATHDLDLLAGLAHELKGVAGMYGFTHVSETARFLQQLAAKANDMAGVEAKTSELIELCRKAAEAGHTNVPRPPGQVGDSSLPTSPR